MVVAHPDDETLACGALLPRLANLTILHVTNGAPRDGGDAARHGFPSLAAYAEARRRELRAALEAGGVVAPRLLTLDVPDQGAAHDLAGIARALVGHLRGTELVLTHAYEGGHPDHDATAFAVRAAVALLGQEGGRPAVVEMPFYRAGPNGTWVRQLFPTAEAGTVLRLSTTERTRKAAALSAFVSQADTLRAFGAADEPYRVAGPVDFTAAPNGGDVLYERYDWGMDAARFACLVAEASRTLRLSDVL